MDVTKVWIEGEKIFLLTKEGVQMWQSLLWYPRLMEATAQERAMFRLNSFGIRWDNIDEDVSFESFTYDQKEPNDVA